MAKRRPSVQKRNQEARNHEKKLAKAARKALRDAARREAAEVEDGEDPDLIGLVPGPQPRPDLDAT
ncbi:MAG: hypothetical protein KTR31_23775 [Myxococcales bacterium]|nr:hypothetical protein [Myxococcales bacterium]